MFMRPTGLPAVIRDDFTISTIRRERGDPHVPAALSEVLYQLSTPFSNLKKKDFHLRRPPEITVSSAETALQDEQQRLRSVRNERQGS